MGTDCTVIREEWESKNPFPVISSADHKPTVEPTKEPSVLDGDACTLAPPDEYDADHSRRGRNLVFRFGD